MEWIYMTFRSITFAQKAQKLLDRQEIATSLLRTPRQMEPMGCSYALRMPPEAGDRARYLVDTAGIPRQKLFAWNGRGRGREL